MAAEQQARVAVVTGVAGGIGAAIAARLAGQGWRLVLSDRAGAALDQAVQACREAAYAEALPADVTREDDVAELVRHAVRRHGRLDGFVAAAGVAGTVRAVEEYPADVFQQVLGVNAVGTFLSLKHALPALRAAGGGSFVALGSTSSIRGRAGLSGYVASKHAVLGLVRTAALEQVGGAVRVNAVLPGPIQTAMIAAINDMAAQAGPGGSVSRAVAAPYGEPGDVADAVAFLLSPAARHMNGSALVLDGGSTLA